MVTLKLHGLMLTILGVCLVSFQGDSSSELVDAQSAASVVALVMKLSEVELRPLFLRLCEWKLESLTGDGDAEVGRLDRRLSFYRVLDELGAALKVRNIGPGAKRPAVHSFVPTLARLISPIILSVTWRTFTQLSLLYSHMTELGCGPCEVNQLTGRVLPVVYVTAEYLHAILRPRHRWLPRRS